ncbi:hypothetical protein KC887_08290 [Candidatus Kaiserbacteria bacterium]|nr:hypothetical protein [Candidatus Kaiserbacteria bacterium]
MKHKTRTKVIFRGTASKALEAQLMEPGVYVYEVKACKVHQVESQSLGAERIGYAWTGTKYATSTEGRVFNLSDLTEILIIVIEIVPLLKQLWLELVDLWQTIRRKEVDPVEAEAIKAVKEFCA